MLHQIFNSFSPSTSMHTAQMQKSSTCPITLAHINLRQGTNDVYVIKKSAIVRYNYKGLS